MRACHSRAIRDYLVARYRNSQYMAAGRMMLMVMVVVMVLLRMVVVVMVVVVVVVVMVVVMVMLMMVVVVVMVLVLVVVMVIMVVVMVIMVMVMVAVVVVMVVVMMVVSSRSSGGSNCRSSILVKKQENHLKFCCVLVLKEIGKILVASLFTFSSLGLNNLLLLLLSICLSCFLLGKQVFSVKP